MRRLLFCGDGCVSSGFARATHAYLAGVVAAGWTPTLLALNYDGESTAATRALPYDVYVAHRPGGDSFGIERVKTLIEALGPDLFVVMNDPWNIPTYVAVAGNTPTLGIVAVDGWNCRGAGMNGLAHAVFWTAFGATQARLGGYAGPASVIPLGVDLDCYRPGDQAEARRTTGIARALEARGLPADTCIVGVCGRNQDRKRLDLTLQYFADWIHARGVSDAVLWLHVAPTGDDAYDLGQLASYYRISNRVFVPGVDVGHGLAERDLARVMTAWDLYWTTTQGEGWGLPALEAMACGVPVLAPDWAALGEWAAPAACLVPCTSTICTPRLINSIGGIADRAATIDALDRLYRSPAERAALRARGLALAAQPAFRWPAIGAALAEVVDGVCARRPTPIHENAVQ
jgi:D-inositol-3-phosphate glycosyltransferase